MDLHSNDIKQPELFDVQIYDEMPKFDCSNCEYGYWHQYDMERIKIGRAPTCTYCDTCLQYTRVFYSLIGKSNSTKWLTYCEKLAKKLEKTKCKDKWTTQRKIICSETDDSLVSISKPLAEEQVEVEKDLFCVDETETQNKMIKEQEHEKANVQAQEQLDLLYYDNPKNDNERLMNYQYLYIKNKDMNAWYKLLELSTEVMKHLLWKFLKEHRNIYFDKITQEEKVSEAVFYVLRRYKSQVGWHVEKNFIGALNSGLLHVTRYETKLDHNTVVTDDVNKYRRSHG